MPRNHIITGLDIGTSSIKILSGRRKPSSQEMEIETVAQYQESSSGIRRGVVIDVPQVVETISSLLEKVQQDSGRKLDGVYASIGGGHIYCTSSRGLVSVSRADQKISEEDIERVLQAAQAFSLPSNKEILAVFPKEFIVDGEGEIKEAVGMQGVRLEAETLVLCAFSPYLKNSTQAILNSGSQINDLVFAPLASARATLSQKDKELGVALLDLGAGTTGLAVFEEGSLIHTAIFPVGSSNITNDIAICLKTDIDTAEGIKVEFGSCRAASFRSRKRERKEKEIRIEGEESISFSKKLLSEIIEARVSEIFDLANKELKKISRQGLLPAGVVLTGGGARLPKIKELAKKEFKLPVRIGLPQGFYPPQEDPSFSSVCGLVLQGADLEAEQGFSSGKGIGAKLRRIFRIFIP